jgi:hypothetical protein
VTVRSRLIAGFLVAAVAAAAVASAQRRRPGGGGFGGFNRGPAPKMMTAEDYNGAFLFCRIVCDGSRSGKHARACTCVGAATRT